MSSEFDLPKVENRELFESRITNLNPQDFESVMFAYDLAKALHAHQKRDAGERYFEHPRNAALILIDECEVNDPDILSAALLHDVMEDSRAIGTALNKTYNNWSTLGRERLTRMTNAEVADIVVAVSKPPEILTDVGSEENSLALYYENLGRASNKARLVKMADRLHNLRTLGSTTHEKQVRKVKETKEHYFPIFQEVLSTYPKEASYLLEQMKTAIAALHLE